MAHMLVLVGVEALGRRSLVRISFLESKVLSSGVTVQSPISRLTDPVDASASNELPLPSGSIPLTASI